MYDSASTVTLSGTVTDIDAAGQTVIFTGLGAGETVTDANGNFSYTTAVSGLGAIDATTTDLWGQASNTAEVDVTAAPTVTLNTQVLAGHQVQLTGTVSGADAAGATVTFSGAVAARTTPDADGNYTYTTSSASLGTVTAVAVDVQQNTSDPTSATIAVAAPTITLGVTEVDADTMTLAGAVTDIDAAGDTIAISGAKQGSVTADTNGNFTFTMANTDLGAVDVNTTDLWGQASNTAEVAANILPPVITGFTATQSEGNSWIFRGTVTAPNMQGVTITFGGIPSLAGQTVNVAADGSFSIVVTLGDGESTGTATAQATDQNGQKSNVAAYNVVGFTVTNPGPQSNYDGDNVLLAIPASDSAGNGVSYGASGLPAGLYINSAGQIVGTIASNADSSGTYSAAVTATDSVADVSITTTFTWNVYADPVATDAT